MFRGKSKVGNDISETLNLKIFCRSMPSEPALVWSAFNTLTFFPCAYTFKNWRSVAPKCFQVDKPVICGFAVQSTLYNSRAFCWVNTRMPMSNVMKLRKLKKTSNLILICSVDFKHMKKRNTWQHFIWNTGKRWEKKTWFDEFLHLPLWESDTLLLVLNKAQNWVNN